MESNKMKKLLTLSLFSFLIFFGCNENLDNTIVSTPTPTSSEKIIDSQLYASELIDGEIGGWLILNERYINGEGRQISVYGRVRILPGSYQGVINIEMFLNTEDISIQLYPEMTFARDVRLDLWYSGVGLQAIGYTSSGDVDFVYFDDKGDIEIIENNNSTVDLRKDKIQVNNAKLYHFSRYGWIR